MLLQRIFVFLARLQTELDRVRDDALVATNANANANNTHPNRVDGTTQHATNQTKRNKHINAIMQFAGGRLTPPLRCVCRSVSTRCVYVIIFSVIILRALAFVSTLVCVLHVFFCDHNKSRQ